MKPIDKFGRQLYPKIFNALQTAGRRLEVMGYSEHPENFNLFSYRAQRLTFYADMRGTEDVPIWKVPVPLFFVYQAPNKVTPVDEFIHRATLIEAQRLHGIDLRLAFPHMDELSGGGPFARRLRNHFEAEHNRIFAQYPWQPRPQRRNWW